MLRLAAAILLAASPAAAQNIPPIGLAPGEAVTVRFDAGGDVAEMVRGAAAWSRFDVVAARHLTGLAPPDAPVPEATMLHGDGEIRPDPVPPNEVRLRFLSIDDRHALLVVENGAERALSYRARMRADGATRPTDVCIVLPRLPSYEHWPYRIERLELSRFRFVPWAPGRVPTCR